MFFASRDTTRYTTSERNTRPEHDDTEIMPRGWIGDGVGWWRWSWMMAMEVG
ncbi:hypothetical protein BD777DRAFT_130441 [Yarrowia lipolytica]|nr:hypothetical protein BD777DRAFT_130441 [Yarrowia lipolytica]